MTRVSTFAQNQFLLRANLKNQARLFDLQRQVGSGEKSDTYKGLRSDAMVLATARSGLARLEQLMEGNARAEIKLNQRETVVRLIGDIATGLKAEYVKAEGAFNGTSFQIEARGMFDRVVALLNTPDTNGNYLFAGSRTDTLPVSIVVNGGPPPAFNITFNNDTLKEQANIGENLTIEVGVLAADDPVTPSGPFVALIEILNYFAAGFYPPPFNAEALPPPQPPTVTPDQIVPLIDQALAGISALDASLGIKQNMIEDATAQLQVEIDLNVAFITQIKDVDMAEVITQVSQQQIALEASFFITGRVSDLSLINFLR